MRPTDFSTIYYVPELGLKFYNLTKLQRVLALYARIDSRTVTIVPVTNSPINYPYSTNPR